MDDSSTTTPCDCDYCKMYSTLYTDIASQNPKWLTVSPPANDTDPLVYYDDWLSCFEKLLACSDNILGVVEFANYRMHFHILYACTDNIKSYKVVNGFRRTAMVRIYNGLPKKELHYLFKDINETAELLPHDKIVITVKKLREHREQRHKEARLKVSTVLDVKCNDKEWIFPS